MDLKELALDLRYISEVVNFLEDIYFKAVELEKEEKKYEHVLDKKFFRKAWDLQIINMHSKIRTFQISDLSYYFFKFKDVFKKRKRKNLTQLEKFNNFCMRLNADKLWRGQNKFTFRKMKFLVPFTQHQRFNERINLAIKDINNSCYAYEYCLYKKDIPLLKELKEEYEKESSNFINETYQDEFDKYFEEKLNAFIEDTEHYRVKSVLFNVYTYHPENLFKNIYFKNIYYMKKVIEKNKLIYNLFLEPYKIQFRAHNKLTYHHLLKLIKNNQDPLSLIEYIDEGTLTLADYNALTDLNAQFYNYPETHGALREIVIEMKERNLIPKNIDGYLLNSDDDFSNFYKAVIAPYELNKQLNSQLSYKGLKPKAIKI